MKNLIAIALCTLVFASANGQQKNTTTAKTMHASLFNFAVAQQRGTASVSGTLYPESFTSASPCSALLGAYAYDGDYLAGNNSFGDKEFLMGYQLSEYGLGLPARVDTVKMFVGFKYQAGNGSVRAKVYADDGTGAPGVLLGTSAAKTVSVLDTTNVTNFIFPAPVALTTNKFFVSLDASAIYATGDSVALLSTDGECSSSTDMGAYLRLSNNDIVAYSAAAADGGYETNFDLAVFPVITANTTGINNIVKNNFSASVYPVPATNSVTISFTGQDNGNTILNLKDITGKTVASNSLHTVNGNAYKTTFDVSSLGRGLYFAELSSGNNKGMIKVSIQ